MSSRNQRYHDRVSGRYDQIYKGAFWDFHDEVTWRHLKRYLPSELTAPVLDLGCGTGKWGLRLAKSGFPVTLLDLSPKMLEQCRRKAEEAGLSERVECVLADIVDLEGVPDGHYDLAVAFGDPLSLCSDPKRAVEALRRVMKPGGLAVLSADHRCAGLEFYFQEGSLEDLERFVKTGRTLWLAKDPDERFPAKMFLADELQHLFEKRGFEVVDLIGKLVLPVRRFPHWLDERRQVERLIKMEMKLHRDPRWMGRASHLQIVVRA
ncbi:MAG: methyltransferase domain-containing protein [Planctomycetota bacterium]